MAEGLISILLEKVIDFAQNEILKVAGANVELDKLEQELKSIQPILRAAHTKLFTSKEVMKEVKGWILRLNEVVYDALDLIDFYRVQHRSNTNEILSRQSKIRKIFDSPLKTGKKIYLHCKIGDKMKEISERLSVLYKEKDLYGLQPMAEGSSAVDNMGEIWERRQTTANITESKIVGREKDEEAVVKWLLEEAQEIEESAYVVAIIGMGGVGKTTLAKKIYNRFAETKSFDKCMWVCVSNSPNLLDLFRKILEEVDENERGSTSQLIGSNALSSRIRKQLKGEKFLLVLDDVWDYEWWKETTGLWRGGRSGSKVLITTRSATVANAIKSDRLLELKGLNYEQSWQLFVNEALRKGEAEQELDGVRDVAEGIVKMCDGLPLALSTVGGVMYQKERRRSIWQDVLNSMFWSWEGPQSQDHSSIFSAIALSYMNIPFPLKQCLTYCCIFPKDFQMEKENLLRLWTAEGFIRKEQQIDVEVSAERHLEGLVACNLIQVNEYGLYTLHDIVHDFAFYIRGEEHVSVDLLNCGMVPDHARICASVGGECSLEGLSEQKLRALVLHDVRSLTCTNFSTFKWLRILDLSGGNILELPESMGDLVLLRYLNLSGTKILKLPESIIQLHDLQTLDLHGSHVKRLPDKLSSFSSIRHLDLKGTQLLEYLPKEIRGLTGLQTLGKFVVGSNEMDGRGSSVRELHDLNHLKGNLEIEYLERVGSGEESQHAQLHMKENLESVMLSCGTDAVMKFNEDFSRKMENVYEALQPPTSISWIGITRYPGVRLPSWMQYCAVPYSCLEEIHLYDCKFLEYLPNFGHLPKLKKLRISYAEGVKVLDTTFDHAGKGVWFPKLEISSLTSMESLEEWRFDVGKENMPRLRHLYIHDCPKLKILPFFSTLESLEISGIGNWEGWPMANEIEELWRFDTGKGTMACLRRLSIYDCPKLRILPIFPTLEELTLGESCNFEGWLMEKVGEWPCLKMVDIKGPCPKLKFLPSSPVLEHLRVDGCDELLALPFSCTLSRVSITNCSKACFSWPSNTTMMQNLKKLEMKASLTLTPPMVERLPAMKQLESLTIQDCPNLTSFPDVLQLTGLKTLNLRDLPHLESSLPVTLPDRMKGLQELYLGPNLGSVQVQGFLMCVETTRLRHLKLHGLHDLELERFISFLRSMLGLERLVIENCPQLVSLVDVFEQHPLPKLRLLQIGSDGYESPRGEMLTCSFAIDSLATSDKLSRLVHLNNKIDALNIWVLDSLPEWMQQLHQLQFLEVSSNELTHLPDWLKNFSKLESLTLTTLPELSSLPDAMASLCQLEHMEIYSCPKLSFLPDWVGTLPRLERLTISHCDDLVNRCLNEDWLKISHIPDVNLYP